VIDLGRFSSWTEWIHGRSGMAKSDEIAEHHKDHFTRRVALTVACIAVALSITSVAGTMPPRDDAGPAGSRPDSMGYTSSQIDRESDYRIQQLRLELDLAERRQKHAPVVQAQADKLLATFAKEEARYAEKKKHGNEQTARELERNAT